MRQNEANNGYFMAKSSFGVNLIQRMGVKLLVESGGSVTAGHRVQLST